MKVYLASMFSRQAEMRQIAATLKTFGVEVTSRWIDKHAPELGPSGGTVDDALENVDDVLAAGTLICFTEPPDAGKPKQGRGGRHVEFGAALALKKQVVVVGPVENIFYNLCQLRLESVDDLFRWTAKTIAVQKRSEADVLCIQAQRIEKLERELVRGTSQAETPVDQVDDSSEQGSDSVVQEAREAMMRATPEGMTKDEVQAVTDYVFGSDDSLLLRKAFLQEDQPKEVQAEVAHGPDGAWQRQQDSGTNTICENETGRPPWHTVGDATPREHEFEDVEMDPIEEIVEKLVAKCYATAVDKGWWHNDRVWMVDLKHAEINLREAIVGNESYDKLYDLSKIVRDFIRSKPYPERSFGDQIALMHSELSEALEEFRKHGLLQQWFLYSSAENGQPLVFEDGSKPEGIAAEFADVFIRMFDTCGRYKIPIAKALKAKMAYNKTRPHRHGGKKL